MKYFVLGAAGFVGRNVFHTLRARGCEVVGLTKANLDLTQPFTYQELSFSDGYVIDCISMLDGDPAAICATNVIGFGAFLEWIKSICPPLGYTYFSTASVEQIELRRRSAYVESKYQAEQKLLRTMPYGKIVRLIFPFGLGEAPNRLISRLISQALGGEALHVDAITLNLTPISLLMNNVLSILETGEKIIQFSDGREYYLPNVAQFILDSARSTSNLVIGMTGNLLAESNVEILFSGKSVETTIEEMINAKKRQSVLERSSSTEVQRL